MKKLLIAVLTIAALALSAAAFDGLPAPTCDPMGHCIPHTK